MPELSGQKAYEAMNAKEVGVPALFTTGYSATMVESLVAEQAERGLLQKPFSVAELARTVRKALDADKRTLVDSG